MDIKSTLQVLRVFFLDTEDLHTHNLKNLVLFDGIQNWKILVKTDTFTWNDVMFNNFSISIILNHDNLPFYEDKETRFDCV